MNQIVQIRQIAQYPDKNPVFPDDRVVLQEKGLGGPYRSATMSALVSTALALIDENGNTFDFKLQPGRGLLWEGGLDATLVWAAGSLISGSPIVAPTFEATEGFLVGGRMVATIDDLNLVAAHNVQSFNGRFGHVQLSEADVRRAGAAPVKDAHFSGWITAPSLWDTRANDDTVATVNWVHRAIHETGVSSFNGRHGCVELTTADINAATASAPPGVYPTVPTAPPGDASSRIANTLFVDDALAELHLIISDEQLALLTKTYAPLDSPQFTGNPMGPTANPGTATGQLATTAFVMAAVTSSVTGVASFNTRTGAVTLTAADVVGAGGAPVVSPALTGTPTAPTAVPGNNSIQVATTAFVHAALAASAGVASFNTRTGAVTLVTADITAAGGAPIASPAFTGTPTAGTATPGTNTGQLATTAFVQAAVTASAAGVSSFNTRTGVVTLTGSDVSAAGGALVASPALTGTPTAPTAGAGTNTTQLATCAFVLAALAAVSTGVTSFNGRAGAVTLTLADVTATNVLASPALTGTPTAPTATAGTSTGQLATTAFVAAAVAGVSVPGVTSFNSRTGAVVLAGADVSAAGGALLASPTFTGSPAAPTPVPGNNSTLIATTAFVMAALVASAVTSFNGRAGAVTLSATDVSGASGLLTTGGTVTGNLQAPVNAVDYLTNATPGRVLTTGTVWNAAAPFTVTDAATVTLDLNTGFDFFWTLGAAGRTMANPVNIKPGQKGVIYLRQDASGGRTITSWGSSWFFAGGTKPVLSTGPNVFDVVSYTCFNSSTVFAVFNSAFG